MSTSRMTLLGPLPASGGEWAWRTLEEGPLREFTELRVLYGGDDGAIRVLVALFDAAGRATMISDLVASPGGEAQDSAGVRLDEDGAASGTRWSTRGDAHVPRPVSAEEAARLRSLGEALWSRLQQRVAG